MAEIPGLTPPSRGKDKEAEAALANAKRPKEPDYLGPKELPPTRIAGADYPASEDA